MITFKFNSRENIEKFHYALVGSKSYIGSEILLSENEDHNGFILVVGNNNDNNIEIDVDGYTIEDK